MIQATAVLITKEASYPQEVLDSLPEFEEILVYPNCPDLLHRFHKASEARNELIYVQDDDCIIRDIPALLARFDGRITNYVKRSHLEWYDGTGITLLGWGAFFRKESINFERYTSRYGFDLDLLREADRIFTFLNQPCNTVVGEIVDLATWNDGSRMSNAADHYQRLERTLQKCLLLSSDIYQPAPIKALIALCTYFRNNQQYEEAYKLSLIPPVPSPNPTPDDPNSLWRLLEEHGLAAYYLGRFDEAREYFLRIMDSDPPAGDRARTLQNIGFCDAKLVG